jgi:arylsulfatase A-like enzyme
MPQRPPHILWILSDEHRGQAMSHAGDPNVRTPVMDAMSASGASFKRAYANCPVCTPSRGSIFSGRHAHCGPVQGFADVYKSSAPSIATVLREAGYHTAYFGKWHCGTVKDQQLREIAGDDRFAAAERHRTPENLRAGFQDWFGFENNNQHFRSSYYANDALVPTPINGYETDGLTDLVIDYLRNYTRDQPLFLVLSVTPPHFPLEVPERWKRHDPDVLKLPANWVENRVHLEALATYCAMIENLDWNLGRLLSAKDVLPRFARERTLATYFSDHGDYMGSHGLCCAKAHPHEESVRVPAIFNWPGQIPPRGAINGLFSLVDLMPTTLGLAGVEIPPWRQGHDFSEALRGHDYDGPDAVLLEMVGNPRFRMAGLDWRGLVTRRWKYAVYETGQEMLFDLSEDPAELRNLAIDRRDIARDLRRELLKLLHHTREPFFDVILEHGVPVPPARDANDKSIPYFLTLGPSRDPSPQS